MNAIEQATEAWGSLHRSLDRADLALWPLSQILTAGIDLAMLTGDYALVDDLLELLEAYRVVDAYGPRPRERRRYFDDNAWIGLALTQLYLQTGDEGRKVGSLLVLRFVETGQVANGGVRWAEGRRSLHTCSTAPAAQLAVRHSILQDRRNAPAFAIEAIRWIDRTMRLPSGLIADHIHRRTVDPTVWSYNQGATLGAFALLHRASGSSRDLERAQRLAIASLRHFRGDVLWRQPPVFNAIWFRNLLALDALQPVPGARAALDAYLDRVLDEARNGAEGLFTAGGIGRYDANPAIDQAGIVQLMALRAWPRDRLLDIC